MKYLESEEKADDPDQKKVQKYLGVSENGQGVAYEVSNVCSIQLRKIHPSLLT